MLFNKGVAMNSTVSLPQTKMYSPRQWSLDYIWSISEDLEIEYVSIDFLWDTMYKDIYVWLDEDEKLTNTHFFHHLERVVDADLNYPIILSQENYILDGVHRLLKAKHLGLKSIMCKKFAMDPAPNL